jgi:hypothetical protein
VKNKHFKMQSVTLARGLLQDTTTVHALTTTVRPISLARRLQATTTTDLEHGLDLGGIWRMGEGGGHTICRGGGHTICRG